MKFIILIGCVVLGAVMFGIPYKYLVNIKKRKGYISQNKIISKFFERLYFTPYISYGSILCFVLSFANASIYYISILLNGFIQTSYLDSAIVCLIFGIFMLIAGSSLVKLLKYIEKKVSERESKKTSILTLLFILFILELLQIKNFKGGK